MNSRAELSVTICNRFLTEEKNNEYKINFKFKQ